MLNSRRTAWVVTVLCVAAFVAAILPMTRRIQGFNRDAHLHNFHADALNVRHHQLGVFPEYSLTDVPIDGPAGQYESFLRLDYAGSQTLIRVKRPPAFDVPNLGLYDEWVKVLAINEVGRENGVQQPVPGTERLLVVSRRTPDGFDPESWGSVRRDDWVFDFYQLKPDGQVVHSQRRWPRGDRAEKRLATETGNPLRTIEPLKPRTVEYFAAMHVIPKLNVPKYKFDDTALSPKVLGWTLPVAMLSVLGIAGGLVFALAPRRGTSPA